MQFSTDPIEAAAAEARPFAGREIASLDRDALVAAHAAMARVRRAAEVALASLSGEIARRSAPGAGSGGLARGQGFRSPHEMVAEVTGGSLADARRLIEAGEALVGAAELAPDGTLLAPPVAPPGPLASALAAREISMEAGALIKSTLAQMAGDTADAQARLVAKARRLTLSELRRACLRERASHDVGAWEARERRQFDDRYATITEDADGMVLISAKLDPPTAAPVVAWLNAFVKHTFRRAQEPGAVDTRSAGQIRADGLAELASHGLDCDHITTGVKTTVVVRVGLGELESGDGLAECDELSAPISVATARRMACDARIIPAVLGGRSLPLDVGYAERLFTEAQRIALGERDGGCAWCGAPPSYCEAHHIRWWKRDHGPTDLGNGVLLCRSCHGRLHTTGWTVHVIGDHVWFMPPPDFAGERVPRLGGRARLRDAAVAPPGELMALV